ncbi:MAG: hypothetical protein GY844_19325 [Bradyrhizobium sp.]|nr:hypothetical protein [Bradyrhizobium sp.]
MTNIAEYPPDAEDRLAYAVSLLKGAEAVAACAHGHAGRRHAIPFFLLIGFSMENGLKAYLEHVGVDKIEKIDRPPLAHNLSRLCALAIGNGLSLPPDSVRLIDGLSDYHQNHVFRYPKNAGTVDLYSDQFAYVWTDEALAAVTRGINYVP